VSPIRVDAVGPVDGARKHESDEEERQHSAGGRHPSACHPGHHTPRSRSHAVEESNRYLKAVQPWAPSDLKRRSPGPLAEFRRLARVNRWIASKFNSRSLASGSCTRLAPERWKRPLSALQCTRKSSGGDLAYDVGDPAVIGVAAGFGAQEGDNVIGRPRPFGEEPRRQQGQGRERGRCWSAAGGSRILGAERARPRRLPASTSEAPVTNHRGRVERLDDALHNWADAKSSSFKQPNATSASELRRI
jgi:hypothetical protein